MSVELLLPPRTLSAKNAGLNNPAAPLLVAMLSPPREATAVATKGRGEDDAIIRNTRDGLAGNA